MTILLKNGHVVDYVNGFEGKKDILIKDGFIRALGDNLECDDKNARVVDCNGHTGYMRYARSSERSRTDI